MTTLDVLLVRLARKQGLSLIGPDGLLKQFTRSVLETALSEEMTEHLGHAKHRAPEDRDSSNVRNGTRPVWLFPGLSLTKHVNSTVLSDQLAALIPGNVRGHRNTALLILACDVPPAVLAALLGLHPGRVERWRQLTGGSLGTYSAARLSNAAAASRATSPHS